MSNKKKVFQDDFYFETESNNFFDRWMQTQGDSKSSKLELRANKKEILDFFVDSIRGTTSEQLRVLEIGCFIGDLLYYLKEKLNANVFGIESSSKAVAYCLNNFNIELECNPFTSSSHFNLNRENRFRYDLIICDDVLSWMSRDMILPVLACIDWMLDSNGYLFLRDFSPNFSFGYRNHHYKDVEIINFKNRSGHKSFFLETGKYYEEKSYLRNATNYQIVETRRYDGALWNDSILKKIDGHLFPVLDL